MSPSSLQLPTYFCSSLSFKKYYQIDPLAAQFAKSGALSEIPANALDYGRLINKFNQAVSHFKAAKNVTIESTIAVNQLFDEKSTGLRKTECWVGKKGSRTDYKCFPPESIYASLVELLEFVNSSPPSIVDLLYIYFRFISIHPFKDGNGRTARALFYALVGNTYDSFRCPFLYHTKPYSFSYFKLVSLAAKGKASFLRSEISDVFEKNANSLIRKVQALEAKYNEKIESLCQGSSFSTTLSSSIISQLIETPLLDMELINQDGKSNEEISELFSELVQNRIVKVQPSKSGRVFIHSSITNSFIRELHLLIMKGK